MMRKNIASLAIWFLPLVFSLTVFGCANSTQKKLTNAQPIDRISEAELARLALKPLAILTLDDIVRLSKGGSSADQIIDMIKISHSPYELTPSQSIALSQQGVDSKVLDYIHASRELALRNSMADEINKREKNKRDELEKIKRQQLQQERMYDHYCRGYYGLHPYGYGVYGSRFGSRFGLGAGYAWPWACW